MRMTFGKYKHVDLERVPHDYLLWVLDNIEDISPTLRRAIETSLGIGSQKPTGRQLTTVDARGLVKSWYRHASTKYHPDHGGSNAAQIVVNDCYESLMKGLERLEAAS